MSVLVGKQIVDFTNKETGEIVQGVKLHYLCLDERVTGQSAETKFIRKDNSLYSKALDLPLGEFRFEYNDRGRLCGISTMEQLPGSGK